MKISLHPLFLFYVLFLIVMGQIVSVFVFLTAVAIHEFAHYFVAKRLGYKLGKLSFMPYGASLKFDSNIEKSTEQILIAIAGPIVNLFLCICTVALWWVVPLSYNFLHLFCFCNFALFVFNLLPCFPLDGGRILFALFCEKFGNKKAKRICNITTFLFALFLLLVFFGSLFFGVYNFNCILISIFLFCSCLDIKSSCCYNFLQFKSKTKKTKSIKHIAVCADCQISKVAAKLCKHKYNLIYVLFEDGSIKILPESNFEKISLAYNSTNKIGNCL